MFEDMAGETKSDEEARNAMKITVNGEDQYFDAPLSVAGLLTSLGIAGGKVAIERNQEIVPKSSYGTIGLSDGDRIEIVHFIGGGA
ncbi:MAG: sulfur carrier protein ThiS [Pseudomonadota bacterium]|nr:sulfur carrier protein ThiS [Pseudomonadota bacterium]